MDIYATAAFISRERNVSSTSFSTANTPQISIYFALLRSVENPAYNESRGNERNCGFY